MRSFLRLGLEEAAPDHSTLSRTRRVIDVETHRAVFEAAARHQGFARAAAELHVSAAAVAHRVRLLECGRPQPRVVDDEPAGTCRCSTASARHVAACATIAGRPVLWPGAILSAQTGGVRPSPAVGIVRARYDSRNNADAKSIPPTTERAGAGYGSRPPCQRPCRSWNGWIAPTSAARASVSTDISISPSLASRGNSPSSAAARWTCARQVSMACSTRVRPGPASRHVG